MGMIKKFNEWINESYMNVTYKDLENDDCTIDKLYNYIIQNYEPIGEEPEFNEDNVIIYITTDYGCIFTENDADDEDKIWAIYFTPELKEYIYKNYPNEYIEDGEITGDDEYERIFIEGENYIHCNKIVDFIDELLNMVPNPALRKK